METTIEKIEIRKDDDKLKEGGDLVRIADDCLTIKNDRDLERANAHTKIMQDFVKLAEDHHADAIKQAHTLHKTLTGMRNKLVDPVKNKLRELSNKMAQYVDDKRREAEEKQRKADEAARKKEEAQKQKLLDKAAAEEQAGNVEKADELVEKAENVYVAPRPVAAAPAPQGFVQRYMVEVEVLDKAKVPDQYKIVDESMLKRMYQSSKYSLDVPGVKFTKRPVGAVRR